MTVFQNILAMLREMFRTVSVITERNAEDPLESSLMLRQTIIRPVCLGIKHPSEAYDRIFNTVKQLRVCCGAYSDARMGLSFATAAGPRQHTVSDSRLPFSLPPTTRWATVEVFDPACTRDPLCDPYAHLIWNLYISKCGEVNVPCVFDSSSQRKDTCTLWMRTRLCATIPRSLNGLDSPC
jgi:hypothetical protein